MQKLSFDLKTKNVFAYFFFGKSNFQALLLEIS